MNACLPEASLLHELCEQLLSAPSPASVARPTRAVGARYRLSPKSRKDLAENLAAALNSLGDQLLPPEG